MWVIYLKGLGVCIAIPIWIVLFNMVWTKFTGENLGSENYWAAIFMPFLVPIIVVMLLTLPLIIGVEFFG